MYTYTGYNVHGAVPLLFSSLCWFPLLIPLIPFLFPFHLLGNPPCCDRIRPPWSQVADRLSPQWVPQEMGRGLGAHSEHLRWRGQLPAPQVTPLHTPILFALYIKPSYTLNGSDGTAYTGPSKVQNKHNVICLKGSNQTPGSRLSFPPGALGETVQNKIIFWLLFMSVFYPTLLFSVNFFRFCHFAAAKFVVV